MYASAKTIALVAKHRWPTRHNRELGRVLGVERTTAQAYVLGKRRMPAHRLRQLADHLRSEVAQLADMADLLEHLARLEERRHRQRGGFFRIQDWGDGIIRDKRWRFGPRSSA